MLAEASKVIVAPGAALMFVGVFFNRTSGGWLADAKSFTHQSARAAKSFWTAGSQRQTGLK